MKPRNLIIATVILAALAGGIFWAQRHPDAGTQDDKTPATQGPKLANITPTQVKGFQITKRDGSSVSVQKQGGRWAITSPQSYAADQDAVSSMLSALSPLNADSVVEDNASDLSKYGLDKPTLAVSIQQNNGQALNVSIGSDVPTASLVYAKWGASPKVYALNSSVKSSFDKSVNDLRDKRLLTLESSKWTRLAVANSNGPMEFVKNAQGDWVFAKPQPYRTDTFGVSELVRKLGDARMDLSASADDQSKAKATFTSGKLIASVKVTGDSGVQTLEVRKSKDDYAATASAVTGDYKINSDLGQALEKGVDDYRNKKLFDFGFNDPDKIILDAKTYLRAGTDWKVSGQTMDAGTVQALIDQLRELAATKFATAGFTQTVTTITVQWNGYKNTERVEISKTANGYVARRSGDPALYELEAKPVDDMLNAGKAIKPATKK